MKGKALGTTCLLAGLALLAPERGKAVGNHDLNVDLWTNSFATITRLEPSDTGFAWIRLNGRTDYGCDSAPNATYGYIIRKEDGGRDVLYSTALAAFMAGKPVKVQVKANGTSTTECAVKKFRVGS